jgi:transcriptional regulator with XRE-family HTH domain
MDAPALPRPATPPAAAAFGELLRQGRQRRALSQMALALQAGVSCRHLSWLETGRANPSRAMVLRLAAQLDLAPRERNTLPADAAGVALPLVLHLRQGALRFLTTVTVFGTPHDLTLAGLAVETLLPADEATAQTLRAALAGLPPAEHG